MARKAIHGPGSECGSGALKDFFLKKKNDNQDWKEPTLGSNKIVVFSPRHPFPKKKKNELMAITKEQILSQMLPSCLETLHSSSPPWLSSLPPKKDVKAHHLAFLYLGPGHPFFSLERDHCWHHC